MGIPFDVEEIDEKREGIIDVEALLVATLLIMEQDRMVTDLPAWIIRFTDLINHQKLKGMWMSLPQKYRKRVIEKLDVTGFSATPRAFKNAFGVWKFRETKGQKPFESRIRKLNSIEHVAQSSAMMKNRLLYGTGFRADLVTVTQVENLKVSAREMSKILSAADSTISRLLNDLRACGFLNQHNERKDGGDTFPRVFISSYSVWNLVELLDAHEFQSKELKSAAVAGLDLRFDGFCRRLLDS